MTPDAVVVGAGPAGSTVATLLARRGWRVLVVDRRTFPRPKACGEFVSPGALRALERLGLSLPPGDLKPARIDGWTLDIDGHVVRAGFPVGDHGVSLPRSDLDAHLLSHARRSGAEVLEGARVVLEGVGGAPRVLIREGSASHRLAPRVLVGAGGLRCPVASHIDAPKVGHGTRKISLTGRIEHLDLPRRRGRLIIRGDLVVGIAPSSSGSDWWNATVVLPSRKHGRRIARARPTPTYLACLREAGLGVGDSGIDGRILASGPFDRPTRRMWMGNTVLVGDAAGYYDPFTGQGIYQALRSAEILAGWLNRGLAGSVPLSAVFHGYEVTVRRERRSTKRLQSWVERALSSAAGRQVVARALTGDPGLYAMLLEVTTDRRGLAAAAASYIQDRATGVAGDQMNDLTLPTGAT